MYFNPTLKGEAIAASDSAIEIQSKLAKKGLRRTGAEYCKSEHLYALSIGEELTGERKRMLGRDAQLKNRLNRLKFGSGEHDRLHRWVWMESKEKETKSQVAAIMAMRG